MAKVMTDRDPVLAFVDQANGNPHLALTLAVLSYIETEDERRQWCDENIPETMAFLELSANGEMMEEAR